MNFGFRHWINQARNRVRCELNQVALVFARFCFLILNIKHVPEARVISFKGVNFRLGVRSFLSRRLWSEEKKWRWDEKQSEGPEVIRTLRKKTTSSKQRTGSVWAQEPESINLLKTLLGSLKRKRFQENPVVKEVYYFKECLHRFYRIKGKN